MALIYNASFDSQTRVLSLLDRAGHVISSCEVPSKGNVDDITKPLTLRATQDNSTVTLTKEDSPFGDFQTSRDGGSTWTDYTINTAITLSNGDEVAFRAKENRTSAQTYKDCFKFQMTGKIEAWHNIMSLYRTNDFATYKSVVGYAFRNLFKDCTSLVKAPLLPATTLAENCYKYMFFGCQLLEEAPALPATTLVNGCYSYMFRSCESLIKSPELTATTLDEFCFYSMFQDCRRLSEVHCKIPYAYSSSQIASYANKWLKGVSSTGTFYTNEGAHWISGENGVPEGWTRVPAVDDPSKPLTFKATQDNSTVTLTKDGTPFGDFQTSRDGGSTWTDYTINTAITLSNGDEVSFRAKANRTSAQTLVDCFKFQMTGKIEAWHNIMSLYRTNDFATYKSVVGYAFAGLFKDCRSLVKAPVLPATTLADSCYWDMFNNTSLTKAPELPATALATDCYYYMFVFCYKLKEVRIAATTTATNALKSWLGRVASTGDFYCDPNATIFPSGTSGCPGGWTRRNIADYPN